MDREFSVFSILPPFNVVNALVVKRDGHGRPYLADDTEVNLFYEVVADRLGSINSYSVGKTDFWQYANALFGVNLPEGQGLTGLYMPVDDPLVRGAQPMAYNVDHEWFAAEGIPITPLDDTMATNTYPLMRISAASVQDGQTEGSLDVVVPVATETDCQNCHHSFGIASTRLGINWSNDPDLEVQSKINILLLHDAEHPTNLNTSRPVLCARCHYSRALDLGGTGPAGEQVGKPNFSNVMHEFHGGLQNGGGFVFPADDPVENTCYQCHPGAVTQCQRGAMKTGGMDCNDCHGDMLAVGGHSDLQAGGSIDGTNDGGTRRPWLDLPRCQSCHTGDAVSYLSGANLAADPNWPFRLRQAYETGDASASPLLVNNKRFAENINALYRFSKGHGGIACENCHGSTHAIWPNDTNNANDNVAAKKLQGFAGPIIECFVCHAPGSLTRTTNGPHGMHNVNDPQWYDEVHENAYEANKDACKACHGLDLLGTPLAKMPTDRILTLEHTDRSYAKGDLVACNRCHGMPDL